MELLLNYLLKSGLCLLVLYLFYYALLRKQPNFAFNRLYLLLATPVALSIPFLKWPASLSTEPVVAQGLRVMQLPEITIKAAPQHIAVSDQLLNNFSFEYALIGAYSIGVILLLFKLCQQLISIQKMAAKATPVQVTEYGIIVLEAPGHAPTFAFLSYVFISRQHHLSDTERKQVLDHEMAHVQLKHTLDILYFEVLTAALWFNPVVWLLKNELKDVHEFQADARVLAKHEISHYSSLLSKEVLHNAGVPVGSYFREPQVFKRLQMLQNNGKRISWIRPTLLLPLLGGLAFVFSSQQLNATLNAAASPSLTTDQLKEVKQDDAPITEVLKIEETIIAEPVGTNEPVKQKPLTAKFIEPDVRTGQETAKNLAESKPESKISESLTDNVAATVVEERPYTYVEQMPSFKGGELALQKFLAKNIRYPNTAIRGGKEGLVFISFTITKEGELTNFEVVKGVSSEIDAEALRVLKLTENNWAAGRQNGRTVPVRFTLPIRFSLNN